MSRPEKPNNALQRTAPAVTGLATLSLMATSHQARKTSALILLAVMFLCGCVTHRDITPSNQYPTDYVLGGVYQFKQDLFADLVDSPLFSHYKTFMPNKPRLVYYPSPSGTKTHRQVVLSGTTLIRAGTRMRIEQFDLERNLENGPTVWIRGFILDGPLAGNRLNVSLISKKAGESSLEVNLLMVDTNYLKRIENP
jgi:hypothetical protein